MVVCKGQLWKSSAEKKKEREKENKTLNGRRERAREKLPCGLQTIAESSHSFASTPRPAYAVLLHLAKRKGNPVSKTRRSQFSSNLHSEAEWPPAFGTAPPYASLHTLPLGSTQVPGSRLHATVYRAVSQVTWNNRGRAECKHVAVRYLINHRCGSSKGLVIQRVPHLRSLGDSILQRALCCTALMRRWQKQPRPQVGALRRGCRGRGQRCSPSPDLLRS